MRQAGLPGPEPEIVQLSEGEDLRETVDRIVQRLVREEGIEPCDIVVLTPAPVEGSAFPASWRSPVSGLTYAREGGPSGHKRNVVRVETVAGFRGLESPVVVFVEPDCQKIDDELDELELMDIALTRATQHLVIVRRDPPVQIGLIELVEALKKRLRDPLSFPRDVRPHAEALLEQANSFIDEANTLFEGIIRGKARDEYKLVHEALSIRLWGRPPMMVINPETPSPQKAAQAVSAETGSPEGERPEPLRLDTELVQTVLRQLDECSEAIQTLLLSSEHSLTQS